MTLVFGDDIIVYRRALRGDFIMDIIKKSKTDQVLISFVKKIKKLLGTKLRRIILFGSRARDDYSNDSDYDLLIVADETSAETRELIDNEVGNILYEYNSLVSAFLISEERYLSDKFNPLLINISREGINL